MKILFFDTETTGVSADAQIIQFGAILWEYDTKKKVFHEERVINQFIKPTVKIHPAAQEIHWITKEKLEIFLTIDEYIRELISHIKRADLLVAHNYAFDKKMLAREIDRHNLTKIFDIENMKSICTMLSTVDFCKLPSKRNEYKRPKLNELYPLLFNWEQFVDAHDALADIRATARCFFELVNKWIIKI